MCRAQQPTRRTAIRHGSCMSTTSRQRCAAVVALYADACCTAWEYIVTIHCVCWAIFVFAILNLYQQNFIRDLLLKGNLSHKHLSPSMDSSEKYLHWDILEVNVGRSFSREVGKDTRKNILTNLCANLRILKQAFCWLNDHRDEYSKSNLPR